ncbi:MAG: hypothetical protein HZC41_24390 [Chloroflexi bacterium]|nr:hypothetical protein [Chloroflexota bacterium]
MITRYVNVIRVAQVITGIGFMILAAAFYFRWPPAAALWPWSGYSSSLSGLSNLFISSVLAAFAVPLIWMGVTGEICAAVPITLDVIVTLLGWGLFMLQSYTISSRNPRPLVGAIICFLSLPAALAVLWFSRKFPFKNNQPMPRVVRLTMGLFVIALLVAGYALLTKAPTIFPWRLTPQTSVMYGWAFWGAAAYFLYGFLNPRWPYAAGQLLGFIIYALVLFFPYVALFETVRPEHRTSLTIFVFVLVSGSLVGVYYLLFDHRTRLWQRRATGVSQPVVSAG